MLGVQVTSTEAEDLDLVMLRDLFGYSPNDKFEITRPGKVALTGKLVWLERVAKENYTGPHLFHNLMSHIRKSPDDFPPDPATCKRRELEGLPALLLPRPHQSGVVGISCLGPSLCSKMQ